ncbi:hypothetical protein HOLleu_23444 [Holothuria leucospilota]|uniref:G-protein coupled receptors family 1 profile domain-containing protein n=1 Tax=Holothuria leucospilota TaxID=206669 RepID=A0A9Q1BV76_HOLLE|nr:hypothetical protein HOLleu_23444 [Holothuria leucospilota]
MDEFSQDGDGISIFRFISYSVLTILLAFGLIAHILAILSTRKANKVKTEDHRHSLPSFLLTCLLRIDMVAVIFLFVRGFLPFIRSIKQHPVWCDFSVSTSIFFTWSSGLANCLMCAERSTSLIAPFFHRRYATFGKAKVTLFVLQILAFIICLLPLFGFGTYKIINEPSNQYVCVSPGEPRATKVNKYHLYFSIIFFVVGFSIITCILVCNVIIVFFILHLKNKITHLNISTIPANLQHISQNSSSPTMRKSSSETRFAMIMILVSIAYMISWLPLYVSTCLDFICSFFF